MDERLVNKRSVSDACTCLKIYDDINDSILLQRDVREKTFKTAWNIIQTLDWVLDVSIK